MRTAVISVLVVCLGCVAEDPNIVPGDGDGDGDAETFSFETEVRNLLTNAPIAGSRVTEFSTSQSAISAANGRALLDLQTTDTIVLHELASHRVNVMIVDADAMALHSDAEAPLVSHVISTAEMDDLHAPLGLTWDDQTSLFLVYVRNGDFSPAAGRSVTLSTGGPAYVRGPGGFELGDAVGADGLILFANQPSLQTTLTVPGCTGPRALIPTAAHITSTFFVCD